MRHSTAARSPPIVMSSPCKVATMCSPLMQPCHTQGHAILLVNLRSLSIDASSSSQFCTASRVPYKLFVTARICVHHLPGDLLAAIRRISFFVTERRSTPFTRRPVQQLFLHVYPWQPLTAPLSAPPPAASTRTTMAWRVSDIPSRPTSRARWAFLVVPCQSPPILS